MDLRPPAPLTPAPQPDRLAYCLLTALCLHGLVLAWVDWPPSLLPPSPPDALAVDIAAAKPGPAAAPSPPTAPTPPPPKPARLAERLTLSADKPQHKAAMPSAVTAPALPAALPAPSTPGPAASAALASSPGDAPAAPLIPPLYDAAYLNNPAPAYPTLSKRLNEQGRVEMRVHVMASGLHDQVDIRKSSGYPRLDQAAAAAVWKWRFTPARQGHEAVAAWVIVPMPFVLED